MLHQRTQKSSASHPQTQQQSSQFAPRPFAIQAQPETQKPATQEEIENEAFNQNKFEAFGLQLKEKSGTIAPEEQERLGVLQAKMNDLMVQRQERTSRNGFNLIGIPIHSPDATGNAPIQTKLLQKSDREGEQQQSLQESSETISNEGMDLVQRTFQKTNPQSHPVSPIQAKLTIGQPGDKYEQEADSVATKVVEKINAPASGQSTQGQSVQRQEEDKEEEVQAKLEISALQRMEEPKEEDIQAKLIQKQGDAIGGGEASTDLDTAINSARGGGQPLDAGLQRSMGQAMGADFSGVKVHTDSQSDRLNQSIQAKAFTTGQDVFFRQGAYDPGSKGGQELIAHELTHVVQQNGGTLMRSPQPPQPLLQHLASETPSAMVSDRAIQAKGEMTGDRQESSEAQRPNQTGLPNDLKSGIENLSGMAMDDVRVNYNSSKPAQLQALAYTQGTEIHVAPGQEQHLPHEAWHVVQQKQGRVKPTLQMKGVEINDDQGLEKEADVMGARAFQVMETEPIQSSDDVLSNQGTRPVIPTAQRLGVIQLSADEAEAAQIAATDQQIASTKMEKSRLKIEAIRAGNQPIDEDVEDPFADLPQTTGHTVATRRTVPFKVDRGNGLEEYRVPVQDLNEIIEKCRKEGWQFEVHSLPRGYELGEQGKIIQRAATATGYGGGTMDENAAATVIGVAAPNLANGNLTFNGVTAWNTSTGASGTSLNRQPNGAGVGNTRPNQWTDFIAMIGAINPFKQGHMISQRLGGDGNHDNLTPFTSSLNGLHYSRVESHVINQTDAAPGRDQYADYSVTPTYGGNAGISNWAQVQFAAMTPDNQRAAMVTAGIMTAAAAAAYAPGTPLTAADLGIANLWLTNYINGAFPTDIVCRAEFINAVAGGTFNSTPPQVVTITNEF